MTKMVMSKPRAVGPPRLLSWGIVLFGLCLVTTGVLETLGLDIVEDGGGVGLVMVGIGTLLLLLSLVPMLFPTAFWPDPELDRRYEQREVVFAREELSELLANPGRIPSNDRNEESIPTSADHHWLCADYLSEQWRPGEIVHISRQGGSLLRKPLCHIVFDWRNDQFRYGARKEQSVPLNAVRQLRLHGNYERYKIGRYNACWVNRWDVCLDAIVDSEPIHLFRRSGFIDPDAAYYSWLPLAATLAITLDIPLRWAGFENHPVYRPPLINPSDAG